MPRLRIPGPRIHSICIHGFPSIQGFPFGCPWFLDVNLQFSIQVWISTLISKQGYPCNGCPCNMNIYEWISIFYGYQSSFIHAFIAIHLDVHWFLWISIHAWTCYGFSIHGCLDKGSNLTTQCGTVCHKLDCHGRVSSHDAVSNYVNCVFR